MKHPQSEPLARSDILTPYSREEYVRRMLFDPITLDQGTFEAHLDSATPGDPDHVFMPDGMPYREAALLYMLSKLDDLDTLVGLALETSRGVDGLLPRDYQAIEREIRIQHEAQSSKNQASFDRLAATFYDDPESIGEWKAIFVKLSRSIDADTVIRLCLLDWYPEMGSIEDLKRTCLADYDAYERARKDYISNLRGLSVRSGGRFTVRIIEDQDLQPRPRDLKDVAADQVAADKTTIALITDAISQQVYEVVEKFSQYNFPVSQRLEGVRPHIVDGVNKQPLYLQMYLTTERTQARTDRETKTPDPANIVKTSLTRRAQEARRTREA